VIEIYVFLLGMVAGAALTFWVLKVGADSWRPPW
jgi:hypothetical protein